MNKSIWSEYKEKIKTKQFKDNLYTDILIIGGGLAGINVAFNLNKTKYKVSLIEKDELLSGTTNYTTAKVTFLQNTVYDDIKKCHDEETSDLYLKSQLEAIKMIKNNIKNYNIDCDFQDEDSYLFTLEEKGINKIKKIIKILQNNHIKYNIIHKLPNDLKCLYGIKLANCGTFNPIKYAYGLLNNTNVDIYEHVRALKIKKEDDKYIIETDKGMITTKYIVTTTHYPFFIIPGLLPLKMHLKKSHVVASKISKPYNFNAISVDKKEISIRYYQNYLLFGGESYKMSNHIDYEKRQDELIQNFKKYFNTDINYNWSTYDLVSNDYLPIIGKIDDNHYVACAFNAWGMTNTTIAGKLISDLINKRNNKYELLFNPKREITLKRTLNFLTDNINITKIYLKTKINKNKEFYKDNVKIVNIDGKSYGIYIDDNQKEHIVRNLCPHAKCSLIFNYQDKTWDYPCHGSKYDIDGNVIKGPSVFDIKK